MQFATIESKLWCVQVQTESDKEVCMTGRGWTTLDCESDYQPDYRPDYQSDYQIVNEITGAIAGCELLLAGGDKEGGEALGLVGEKKIHIKFLLSLY